MFIKIVIVAIVLLCILIFIFPKLTVSKKVKHLSTERVFTQEELERIEKEVSKKEIEKDKGNELPINSKSKGAYPRRKGVILVTRDKLKGIIPSGHAAIIYSHGTVVESLYDGVTTGANDWYKTRNTCYGVTVRDTTTAQDQIAADWCYKNIGKPYNFNYLNPNTRNSFYCSQLVYAAFLDNFGINLNTPDFGIAVHPMELVNTNKTTKIYEK